MKTAIERHSLIAKKGTCYEAVLENANCRFIVCGHYEDRVHCRFSSRTLRGSKAFDLHLYMYVRFGEWASELLPKPDHEWSDEKRIAHLQDGYNSLLLDGWLQEPLGGNFTWAADYHKSEAEGFALASKLEAIKTNDKAAWDVIRGKLAVNDYSWIGDAKAVVD